MRKDGAANRERILAAAEQVFGVGGAAASTEEVARRAEVGVATVFRHFPTKQQLLEATAVRYLHALQADIEELTDHIEPGPALAAAVRVLVSSGPTKVTLLNLLLTDGGELSETITGSVHTIRQLVGRLLARAQHTGTARPDTTLDETFALARALAHIAGPPQQQPTTDRAVEIVLDGLAIRR